MNLHTARRTIETPEVTAQIGRFTIHLTDSGPPRISVSLNGAETHYTLADLWRLLVHGKERTHDPHDG